MGITRSGSPICLRTAGLAIRMLVGASAKTVHDIKMVLLAIGKCTLAEVKLHSLRRRISQFLQTFRAHRLVRGNQGVN
jgi:hypothetical protein